MFGFRSQMKVQELKSSLDGGHFLTDQQVVGSPGEAQGISPGRSARGVQAMPRRQSTCEREKRETHPPNASKVCPTQARSANHKHQRNLTIWVHNERHNQARKDVDEKTTRGPDELTRRTDSTNGLDERTRGLAGAAG